MYHTYYNEVSWNSHNRIQSLGWNLIYSNFSNSEGASLKEEINVVANDAMSRERKKWNMKLSVSFYWFPGMTASGVAPTQVLLSQVPCLPPSLFSSPPDEIAYSPLINCFVKKLEHFFKTLYDLHVQVLTVARNAIYTQITWDQVVLVSTGGTGGVVGKHEGMYHKKPLWQMTFPLFWMLGWGGGIISSISILYWSLIYQCCPVHSEQSIYIHIKEMYHAVHISCLEVAFVHFPTFKFSLYLIKLGCS